MSQASCNQQLHPTLIHSNLRNMKTTRKCFCLVHNFHNSILLSTAQSTHSVLTWDISVYFLFQSLLCLILSFFRPIADVQCVPIQPSNRRDMGGGSVGSFLHHFIFLHLHLLHRHQSFFVFLLPILLPPPHTHTHTDEQNDNEKSDSHDDDQRKSPFHVAFL